MVVAAEAVPVSSTYYKPRHLPGLEGLRAVAAFGVILTHVAFQTGVDPATPVGAVLARFDFFVPVFFALSAFLLWRGHRTDRRLSTITRYLLNRTGLSWDHVVWDQGKGRWDTGRRAWELADPDASHHLVLQDDALPCQDLILGLEMALARIPAHRVLISLFFGTPHAGAQGLSAKERAIGRAQQVGASWIILRSLNWGLGIVLPTAVVPNMLDWCDQQTYPEYDKRDHDLDQSNSSF